MNIISLFSGAGGMDLGFELAGHNIVWANDIDKDATETYKKNLNKNNIVLGDIKDILNDDVIESIPNADVIIGGFPCQGFTIANINRSMNDERNYLYLEILKMIELKNPKFFILENVKGLENMESGLIIEMILNDLKNCGKGYRVSYNVFNALNFGVPQNRERVIIFGVRNDIEYDIPKVGNKKYKNLYIPITHSKDSNIKDLKKPHERVNELYKNFIEKNFAFEKNKTIYSFNTIRDAIFDLPEEFLDYKLEQSIYNHNGSKCKVKVSNRVGNRETYWDKYAPTIMGRGSGTGGPLIIPHPNNKRRLSVRETARLQTFPDKFIFLGSNSSCYRQIGNAVPVLMAYNIARILPK